MEIRIHEEFDKEILSRYEICEKIGKGATGTVYKASDKLTNNYVAIKKIYDVLSCKSDSEKLYREIRMLEHLRKHNNIIKLLNVILSSNQHDIYAVFEYMEANLFNVSRANILTEQHIKYITYQLLKAIKFIHSIDIIHRDLKSSHILINSDSKLKLADFKLAIISNESSNNKITEYTSTRWYRPPELLLNSAFYDKSIDMWSIGCIMGEMLCGKTLFPGSCTLNQLALILELIGKPSDEDISSLNISLAKGILDNVKNIKTKEYSLVFKNVSEDALDLLKNLLVFNPKKRLTVEKALEHPYFNEFRNFDEEIICEEKISFEITDEIKCEIKAYKHLYKEGLSRANTNY